MFRYDEEWGSEEDESEKRKKDFGNLFKKQMNLRKVNTLAKGESLNLLKTWSHFTLKNVITKPR